MSHDVIFTKGGVVPCIMPDGTESVLFANEPGVGEDGH